MAAGSAESGADLGAAEAKNMHRNKRQRAELELDQWGGKQSTASPPAPRRGAGRGVENSLAKLVRALPGISVKKLNCSLLHTVVIYK
ncbi:hypothetical protein NDU88_002425 [Pleurodeles waltl]|uniref:Uncharacterized protein n=1 Tax=Pleurodeles waltl TaxID=8319 RepID=A0AAV7MRL5_PLEWA|nr:hypothetical protein NDU88_002425 [Pleurodeles waltl]